MRIGTNIKIFFRVLKRTLLRCSPSILDLYLIRQFLGVLFLCLFAATSLFLVFELFEKMRIFVGYHCTFAQALAYLLLKVPLIVHLMTPVAVLVATLLSVGRLSQMSEITAMRACGASVFSLARPLLFAGAVVAAMMFIGGETVVPWATRRGEEIYHLDIKKKDVQGNFSRTNFWYRENNKFYSIGYYDSRNKMLTGISTFEMSDRFALHRRVDAQQVDWSQNSLVGWTMKNVVEIVPGDKNNFEVNTFRRAPLLFGKTPSDLNMERNPETLSYSDLKAYIAQLSLEGVPVTKYMVDLAAKISFPLVNIMVVLIAFPFALIPARSGNMSVSFVAGVSIGFGYYVLHAVSTSLGSAELLPVNLSAWTANIILALIGGYLLAGAEYN